MYLCSRILSIDRSVSSHFSDTYSGAGLRLFSDSCGADAECGDLWWAALVAVVGAVGFALFLIQTTGRDTSGMLSVLLCVISTVFFICCDCFGTDIFGGLVAFSRLF